MPLIAVPSFDGKGGPFSGHAMEVELRGNMAKLEVGRRASALVSQMERTARDVCMAMGSGQLTEADGAARLPRVPA